MESNNIVQQAIEGRRLSTRAQVRLFDEALALIAASKKTEQLHLLYQMLDDQCEHLEVAWGVVHVLEEVFPPEAAIDTLFEAVPQLQGQAPEWLAILNRRWFERRDMQLLARRQLAARTQEQQAIIVECFPSLQGRS